MRSWTSLAAALMALAGLTTQAASQDVIVKVGIAKALATAATMIAVEKGYFKEAGVKVEIENLDSAANVITLLAQNQLQIVEGGIAVNYFNALERNLPITIVADRVSTPLSHKLLIRADLVNEIKSPADLKGRSIATNALGAVTTYEIAKVLGKHNISIKDVDLKTLSFVNMGIALTNKAIDAAMVIQPWALQYADRGIAKILADPDDYADPKPLTIAVNFVNTDWANKNRDLLRRYYTAYQRGVYDYCQAYHGGSNRKEVIDIIVRTGLEERADVIEKFPWPARNPNGRVNMPAVLDMQQYYIREGLVKGEQPSERLVNNEFVDYAIQQIGPFKLENTASKLEGCR
jgi:NitT/TauT family transport system substrate-binding protein